MSVMRLLLHQFHPDGDSFQSFEALVAVGQSLRGAFELLSLNPWMEMTLMKQPYPVG
jgi:hypothetical protein